VLDEPLEAPIKLVVKVVPGSSSNSISGWLGDALKVRVTEPAERGKANVAVEKLIAEALGLPRNRTRVVAGKTSARKLIEIADLSESEVHRRLDKGAT
jgi:uncharacterized protein YggU (UPF0235/DUF167 family)